MFSMFGKSPATKERLIELITKFENQRTPLENKPQSNSMGSAAARGYSTIQPDADAEDYFSLKNEFAVDLLTNRAKYNIPKDKEQYFFTEVAQETTNGRKFMEDNLYTTFRDVTQVTGGRRRRTRNRRRKHKTKRY